MSAEEDKAPFKLSGKLKLVASNAIAEQSTEANFTIILFTYGWRYSLEFAAHKTGSREKAMEVACNGKDIYEVITLTPEAHRKNLESDRAKVAVGTSGQEAIVSSGVVPRNTDPIHIFPWLAFCSKSYCSGLQNKQMMTNIFQRSSWPTNQVRFKASFGEPSDLFPSTLEIYKPGFARLKAPRNASKSLVQNYPPPYDSGFIGAAYRVKSWTRLSGKNIPKESLLAYHDLHEVDGRWQLTTNLTIVSVVEKLEFAPDAEVLPMVKIDTQVLDLRFPAKGWISYFTTSNSPNLQTEPPVSEKLTRAGNRVMINGK
ncbi:MAG: hypothetical protein JWM16_4109 [Verrucomicrobiales bacterium]|nr:hypothetical protein [Verrucomicrobiales bacterium]